LYARSTVRPALVVMGFVLAAIGAIWMAQGAGLLKGSFMTGSIFWFWIGAACFAAAVGVIVASRWVKPER